MNKITEAVVKFNEKLLDKLYKENQEVLSLDELTEMVEGMTRDLACGIIEAYVEDISSRFFESDERRNAGIISKDRTRMKSVLTSCGMVYLVNDVYEDQNAAEGEQKYVRPVMSMLGISPHRQISNALSDVMTMAAMNLSYEDAACGNGRYSNPPDCAQSCSQASCCGDV